MAAERANELSQVLGAAHAQGYRAAMVTLTVRHRKGQSLAEVWGAVSKGWGRVTSGKGWVSDQDIYQVKGYARAVEVTHGAHGWHVHIHAAVVYRGTDEDGFALGARMFGRWKAGVESAGFESVAGSGGFDVQISREGETAGGLARYLAKQGADLEGLAREATMGAIKQARGANRTPFQIARDFLDTGDAADLATWHEWEKTSRGKRQLTWSKGMRELAGLEAERSDEDIAADEVGTADDGVVLLPGETWRKLRKQASQLLDIAEQFGPDALKLWLDYYGHEWQPPPE